MTFIWPIMLVSLAAVPLAAWLYLRVERRRRRAAERLGDLGLWRGPGGRQAGPRRHIPPALFLAGLAILLFSLARPQMELSLPRQEGTIILAFDVSGSMAADDIQPTRMEAAQAAASDFVDRQPGGIRVGVVAFSDSGLAVQVPTDDRDAILGAIGRLKPQRGTSLGQGILSALAAITAGDVPPERLYSSLDTPPEPLRRDSSAAIVLLTDGENNEAPDPREVAQAAADMGVRIYTVGVGSPGGATLNLDGFSVRTQLDEPMLREIARISEGSYFSAASQEDLQAIYDSLDLQFVVRPEQMEITALLSGAGLLCLIVGGALSLIWFGRVP
ncbi:VWA domain-containing protein [Oscillochloris sp. ZM17-4]|uniref:VWA domain-containing protein n=1 Tax=Oscillochloris sp. ZM17-4 TaxID=2866714 RepID=UPI001C73A090|nr:VWA domain-containing protein [Oscillochloris sp. ZM17-4]MBX0329175.1 VWA domain-containing protein [Oscillochloris sp. ZM17-4]